MILLLDNYDSFVHNLARYLCRLGQETCVVRSDAIDPGGVRALKPAAIVISPGPCTPLEAGCSISVVRELWQDIPLLGVCLGHQAIAAAFGANIVRASHPMHGRTSQVFHNGQNVFQNIPNPTVTCRYHSLIVEEAGLPSQLKVTARTAEGVIMAIEHVSQPVVGLQFHPEAILTDHGYQMLANFLQIAGVAVPSAIPSLSDECTPPATAHWQSPDKPLTF